MGKKTDWIVGRVSTFAVRQWLLSGLKPTGRAGKTTLSIRAKLIRERTRLSRMQDVAGCRVLVDSVAEQNRTIEMLKSAFPDYEIFDRRENSSHGYRAVHFVALISEMPIEIQVRTNVQHAWAELSEKLSYVDPTIKYGGGPKIIRETLDRVSDHIRNEEDLEESLRRLREADKNTSLKAGLEEKEDELRRRKLQLRELCRGFIITLERRKGEP